jgi:hypothetical protein
MKRGYLSEFFKGIAVKRLSAVEADIAKSHQHEFNGVKDLKNLLGNSKRDFSTKFIYLNDWDDEPIYDIAKTTWYDARENHPTRTEWRLYFSANNIAPLWSVGDTIIICLNNDDTMLIITAEKDSTIEKQLLWLFGIGDLSAPIFTVKNTLETEQDRLNFASRYILEKIDIYQQEEDENLLDVMLREFNGGFPTTEEFSAFARTHSPDVCSIDNPDQTLLYWMNYEEILFRTLEKHLIADRISKGFIVDDFIPVALSVLNRRKSRAGAAFENHIEQIFKDFGIKYSKNSITEGKKRPDFIFPNIELYHNEDFPSVFLTMLGVKTTSKDRWRQICSEADRIQDKHLLTLEPSISINQTNEMLAAKVHLVVPEEIRSTYTDVQKSNILNLADFLDFVSKNQNKAQEIFLPL